VEGAAVEPAARRASEPAEAVNAAQETPAASASEEAKPARGNARRRTRNHGCGRGGCRLGRDEAKLLRSNDEKQEAAASSE